MPSCSVAKATRVLLLRLHVWFIFAGHATLFCCYGYAIDLLVELSKTVNFTYDLHLSDEGYGSFERVRYD